MLRAVVLVGGFGTRLRPLTLQTPKQMLPVVDRPMIEWVCEHLASFDVDEAVLSLGYRPEMFTDAYPDGRCAGVKLRYAVEPEPLDTAGAIAFAAREAGIDERFVVVNGDVLTDLDVGLLVKTHRDAGGLATITLTPVDDPSRYGVVPTDESGRVLEFVEKPAPGTAPTNWINAGTYVLEPEVLDRIPSGRRVSIERETFPALAAEQQLYAMHSNSYWVDAGTPETYITAQLDLAARTNGASGHVDPSAQVHDTAELDGSIVMAGASIGAGAVVRRSAVLSGGVVGAGAVVADSVVGPGATVGERAELHECSILGDGSAVDAGTVHRAARIPRE
ncbi:MAG: NDP-sugar synthase [Actinomycetota bacterium]|nr:NDP-sugar synthase [Actinomycetota bacterium]